MENRSLLAWDEMASRLDEVLENLRSLKINVNMLDEWNERLYALALVKCDLNVFLDIPW